MTRPDTVTVRIPNDLWKRIQAQAEAEARATGLARSANNHLIYLLNKALGAEDPD